MTVERARVSDEIELAYEEVAGDRRDPPLLMVQGLGAQMVAWRDGLLHELAARGLRVIRFDNRDVGFSTHLDGVPDMRAMMAGDRSSAVYTIEDMATDTLGLMDALGLDSVHLCGVSMGGMIAQTVAAVAPERVRSLTSMSSTTGERAVSQPTEEARANLFGARPTTADEAAERAVASAGVIGSPGLVDEEWVRWRGREEFERAFDPGGYLRQLAAIWASGNRTEVVRTITAPTLVLHGELDPLIPLAGGQATARAVEGAELVVIEGMAHDLPPELWPQLVEPIARHVHAAESQRARVASG